LSVFFGFGIVLLSVVQSCQRAARRGLSEFIFGKAAALTAADVTTIGVASVIIMLACAYYLKELSLLCFE